METIDWTTVGAVLGGGIALFSAAYKLLESVYKLRFEDMKSRVEKTTGELEDVRDELSVMRKAAAEREKEFLAWWASIVRRADAIPPEVSTSRAVEILRKAAEDEDG